MKMLREGQALDDGHRRCTEERGPGERSIRSGAIGERGPTEPPAYERRAGGGDRKEAQAAKHRRRVAITGDARPRKGAEEPAGVSGAGRLRHLHRAFLEAHVERAGGLEADAMRQGVSEHADRDRLCRIGTLYELNGASG